MNKEKHRLNLVIADLTCQINLPDRTWYRYMKEKYRNFLAPNQRQAIDFRISVESDRKRKTFLARKLGPKTMLISAPDNKRRFRRLNATLALVFATLLIDRGGIVLHASAAKRDQRVYVFCARSGGGKSTIIKNSKGISPLADDAVITRKVGGKFFVYISPFLEKNKIERKNQKSEIAKIAFIRHATNNRVRTVTKTDGQMRLMKFSLGALPIRELKKQFPKIWNLCGELAHQIDLVELEFTKNCSFWPLLEKSQ